jgi:pimeloyl-ACP methyl ester carboxylesterase
MQFIVQGYPAYACTGGRAFDPKRPAIVFIHGAALDHSVWQWQSRYFAHHGYCVIAVDLPAHGRSPGAARASIAAMADWVAALMESAGLAKADVVGHSMGSLVALDMALRHGARIRRLALLCPSVPMVVGEPFLAAARDDAPEAFDMEAVWGHARNIELATSAVPGANLLGASRQLMGRSRPGVQALDLAACHGYTADAAALAHLNVPVLVIAGARDLMTPARAGQALAQQIPGAKVVLLDAGHAVMSEQPRATLAALRDFLA